MDLGADDYLTKPFDDENLISAIESRLAKAELLRSKLDSSLKNHKSKEQQIRTLNELKNFFDDYGKIESYKARARDNKRSDR